MKVLLYHWTPFYLPKEGGGISVYLSNLIPALCKVEELQITTLSSGFKSNPIKKGVYIRQTKNPYSGYGCCSWEIINSPVISPRLFHFRNPLLACEDNEVSDCFIDFVLKQGGFDVIHFHSLEGLVPQVLKKIKEHFPKTQIIFSVHDYHPICPAIRLFNSRKSECCVDYKNGEECMNCVTELPANKRYGVFFTRFCSDPYNKPFAGRLFRLLFRKKSSETCCLLARSSQPTAEHYSRYRSIHRDFLNQYADAILTVSNRTGQVLKNYGIAQKKLRTSYIGTSVAEHPTGHQACLPASMFTIAYMGYANAEEKGFHFLVRSLEKLPIDIANNIRLVVAARGANKAALTKQLKYLKEVIVYDGYTHENLPKILKDVHLGIVPVLWEDNLPQIAIEMVAHGVPILASDAGGASELCTSPHFRFRCGDETDFLTKLSQIIRNPNILHEYWKHHIGLTTMKMHIKELIEIYNRNTP